MKKLLIILAILSLSMPCVIAQEVSLHLENVKLGKVLTELKKQTGYSFSYSNQTLDTEQFINVDVEKEQFLKVLDEIFVPLDVQYEVDGKKILLKKESGNIQKTNNVKGKYIEIKGYLRDESGVPIPGASVLVKGTLNGEFTTIEGFFHLKNVPVEKGAIIVFSCIGFKEKEIKVTGAQMLNVVLEEYISKIGEVVVTGYQTISKRESASSTFAVKSENIMVNSATSIDQMMGGIVPGMSVISTSGEPSSTPKIRIRGNATIYGNKSPVWVVDGVIVEPAVPFSASELNGEDAEYLIGNAIAGLNPQDIKTITVLKDASATAIYGVKAANGVIVITTKKGEKGNMLISYRGNVSISQRPTYRNFDRMNSQERMLLSKDIVALGYRYPRIPSGDTYEGVLQELYKKNITQGEFSEKINELQSRNTDWYKEIFRNAIINNHNLNISGGGNKANYYFSLGYNDNSGSTLSSNSNRITSLAKVNVAINKKINLMAKIDFSSSNNRGYHETINPHLYAYKTSRTLSPYDKDGGYAMYDKGFGYMYNFLKEESLTGQEGTVNNFNGLINLRAELFKGLSYQGVFAYHTSNSTRKNWAEEESNFIASIRGYEYHQFSEMSDKYKKSNLPYGGILRQATTHQTGYTVRNTLSYKKFFNDVHDIHIMGGIEIRSNSYEGVTSNGYGWIPEFGEKFMPIYTDNFVNNYVRTGRLNPLNTNNVTQVASYFGTASYSYDSRYVLNANMRSDGSNKFGSNPRYRWLPTWSVAGKWAVSEESFFDVPAVNSLDFRASYGIQGNIHDDASPELIVRMLNKDGYSQLDRYEIYRLPNPNLRWEKTKVWNVATDFALFDRRLKGSFELYKKHTSDLIHSKSVPSSNGRTMLTINSGEMTNQGIEGFLNVDIIRSPKIDWSFGINFSRNINKVLTANDNIYSEKEKIDRMLRGETAIEGEPIGSMYSYHFAGLSPKNGYPLFYTKDGRKVHLADAELLELVNCGSIYPKIYGGFDTQLSLNKKISLNLGFSYNLGGVRRLPMAYQDYNSAFDPTTNVSTELKNRWKKPGDEAHTSVPAIFDKDYISYDLIGDKDVVAIQSNSVDYLYPAQMYNYSDVRVLKTNFLRLRMVSLSYKFDKAFLKKIGIQSCLLRLQATNLHLWASKKWKGLDPETPNSSIPILPVYGFSMNITF